MWAMRLNTVDWGYLKIRTLQEILKTQNPQQAEFCAFLEVEHLFRSVGCARSKRQYLTALQNQRSYRWMLGCVWTVYLRSTCGERLREYQQEPERAHGKLVLRPKAHPRLNVSDQNVDPSIIDRVPSNVRLSEKESQLYIFEDNEAVIKMLIKGRSPTMRHVSRAD